MGTPLADVVDRYTILRLKMERIGGLTPDQIMNEKPSLEREFALYGQAMEEFRQEGVDVSELTQQLYEVNAKSWDVESSIRQNVGRFPNLSQEELEKAGEYSIMLRDFNDKRMRIKKEIAKKYNITTKTIEVPLAEIADRYSILRLKTERIDRLTPDQIMNEKPSLEREFALYGQAIEEFRQKGVDVSDEVQELYEINARTWDMESDIRQGKEDILGLAEVGRRYIFLRKFNSKERTDVRNQIAEKSKTGFKEVKIV